MLKQSQVKSTGAAAPKPRAIQRMPQEGDNNVYSQTWWPVCLSREVDRGQVIRRELMGGNVIVYRSEDGRVSVLSAYCAHLGADLSVGKVIGNNIRCPFHHFEYDHDGRCVKTGVGEPPPAAACVFKFPTEDRHGVIWAFNGEEPLFDMWSFSYPDDEIVVEADIAEWGEFECDPWVVIGQIPDAAHAPFVHNTEPTDEVELEYWEYGASRLRKELDMGERGKVLNLYARIFGTNIAVMESTFKGEWSGGSGPLTIRRNGVSEMFTIRARRKDDDSPEAEAKARDLLAKSKDLGRDFFGQDVPILKTIRFVRGTLLSCDREVGRYLDYLRHFPRANPAAEYIYG